MVVHTDSAQVRKAAQIHARISAHQSSARLPGLRQGRRVRTAGHGVPLRRGRKPLHRNQDSRGRAAVVAGGLLRRAALHSLLPLRARLRRRHGRGRARRGQSRRGFADRAQRRRSPRTATNAASASISARSARSPAALIVIRRGPGRWSTSAPSARTARTAARPRSACATIRSSAATTATAPASTASSSASRAATHSISTIIQERLQSPMIRVNGKLEPASWSKALATIAEKFSADQSARREVRRRRLEPHDQRREFLPAEVRAAGPGHEQHRSPPHRRCGDADRCA